MQMNLNEIKEEIGNMMRNMSNMYDRLCELFNQIESLDPRAATLRAPVHEREWVCSKCTTTNMLDVPICQACGASRSGG